MPQAVLIRCLTTAHQSALIYSPPIDIESPTGSAFVTASTHAPQPFVPQTRASRVRIDADLLVPDSCRYTLHGTAIRQQRILLPIISSTHESMRKMNE